MRSLLSLVLVLPTAAQIISTPTQVTATAGTLACTVTKTTITCTAEGKPYLSATPPLTLGRSAAGTIAWSGDQITYALTMYLADGTTSWFAAVSPLGGVTRSAAGTFAVTPAGPVTLGTLIGGVCRDQGTGFHVVPGVVNPPPDGTVTTPGYGLSNEVQGNCVLP